MAILVTGGAGYIGAATVRTLQAADHDVVVLDNLSRGRKEAVPDGVPLYVGNVGDAALVRRITAEHDVDACLHFAAFAYVGESVEKPLLYYRNNVLEGIALIDALVAAGVHKIVFSSSCSVYGDPKRVPVTEDQSIAPVSPYGRSKAVLEQVLADLSRADVLRAAMLRYFNASGALPDHGEVHDPETHLIPLAIEAVQGKRDALRIFGTDYPTPDGTAMRDYIHIHDLANAHVLALDYLRGGGATDAFNLGTGTPCSVLEVAREVGRAAGHDVPVVMENRRPGDPAVVYADHSKAKAVLKWTPACSDLPSIIRSAWDWHRQFEHAGRGGMV